MARKTSRHPQYQQPWTPGLPVVDFLEQLEVGLGISKEEALRRLNEPLPPEYQAELEEAWLDQQALETLRWENEQRKQRLEQPIQLTLPLEPE